MKKALLALIICFLIMAAFFSVSDVYAEPINNRDKAEVLKELGLFKGTNNGFELEREAQRVEGGIMVVRLLGREKYAQNQRFTHPFKDIPVWAESYIGYMYHSGLTKGTGEAAYSPYFVMSAEEYLTFILRALGYDDKIDDFDYKSSAEKALEIGLINQSEYDDLKSKKKFMRDDMVNLSYKALGLNMKNSFMTLIEKLVEFDGVVTQEAAKASGLYVMERENFEGVSISDYGYIAKNGEHLAEVLKKSITELDACVEVDLREYTGDAYGEFEAVLAKAKNGATDITGINSIVKSWSYKGTQESMKIEFEYYYTDNHMDKIKRKAQNIIKEIINPEMTEYEKEIAIHDYIIDNTVYDFAGFSEANIPEHSYTIYGTLFSGRAVCQGYAETMKFLSSMAGLECWVVLGEAFSFESWGKHTWNIIKIDGEYYHVDVTFDDPVVEGNRQILSHNYFNITDKEISVNHKWERNKYPVCTSIEKNYFYVNDFVVDDKNGFEERVKSAVEGEQKEINIKINNFIVEDYEDINQTVFESGNVESFSYSINRNFGIIRITDIVYIDN